MVEGKPDGFWIVRRCIGFVGEGLVAQPQTALKMSRKVQSENTQNNGCVDREKILKPNGA